MSTYQKTKSKNANIRQCIRVSVWSSIMN